jgi:hypothetical protein
MRRRRYFPRQQSGGDEQSDRRKRQCAGRRRASEGRRRRANAGFLTPGEFVYRLGWLLVVVLSVAVAVNGLAALTGH